MLETLKDNEHAVAGAEGLIRARGIARDSAAATPATVSAGLSERTVRREVREDQICVVTFDRPASAANIFDHRTLRELSEEIDFIAGASQLQGVIFTSAKRSIFIAGADLHMMSQEASS